MVEFRTGSPKLLLLVLLLTLPVSPAMAWQDTGVAESGEEQKTQQRLSRLIEQLGSEEFSVRQAAKAELGRMGLEAFDALFEAQDHADIEVALAARYLIRSMNVHWARDDDPEEVRRILNDYRTQSSENRLNLMHRLAALDDGQGITPLCRIVRYESDGSLAKQAALLLLEIAPPEEKEHATKWATSVRETIGNSRRSAAQWALAYAETLEDPTASLATWDRLIRAEHQTLLSYPDKSDREIVRQLMRWQAELLLELDQRDDAIAVMRRSIGLLESDRRQLLDWIDWLILHEAPELVTELAARFDDTFADDGELIYRLAETQLKQGLTDEANASAKRAQEIQPQNVIMHYTLADELKKRELFDWSEQEYRVVIDNSPPGSVPNNSARIYLSEMLHDIQKDKAAGDVLQELVTFAEANADARQALASSERTVEEVKARMNFFYSAHLAANANLAEAKKKLSEGFEADPLDVDLLIAMYRLNTDDPEWKEKTMAGLKSAIAHYRNEITKFEKLADGDVRNPLQRSSNIFWAMACNQYAWLVANTEGDYQDAIKQSHQSLKLRPDSASFLDTLGRCYYAAGDLENAVKYQRQAVELEPHMGQIRRQLEQFEKELKEKQANPKPGEEPKQKSPEPS